MKEYIVAFAAMTRIAATGHRLRPQPEQADKLGPEDFLNPEQNIRAGVYLLSLHLENHPDDLHRALMAYQYGGSGTQIL